MTADPASSARSRPGWPGPGALAFAGSCALLLLFRRQALAYPPYWDAILGPFHEALWLDVHDFDFAGLARDALGYSQGGPRAYFFSFYPALQALLMRGLEERRLFLLANHLLQIALASGAVAIFAALVRERFGRGAAWLSAPLLLLHPLFLSQAYAIGMEMPVLLLGLAGVRAWLRGRWLRAGAWVLACCHAKANGLVIALALAAAGLALRPRELRQALWLAAPAFVYALEAAVARMLFLRFEPDLTLRGSIDWLRFAREDPSIVGGAALALLLCPLLLLRPAPRGLGALRERLAGEPLLLVSWLVCAQVVAASLVVNIFLARYFLIALPFLLLALIWTLQRASPRLLWAAAPLLLLAHGARMFAQPPGIERTLNNGHQLERTLAYEDDLELNLALARRLEERYPDSIVVASWPFVHMFASPAFGYVDRALEVVSVDVPALHWLGVPSARELDLSDPRVTQRMLWVWSPNDHARENRPDTLRDTLVERLERGERRAYLYRRSPAFYERVSQPGFTRWESLARRIGPEALERWAASAAPAGASRGSARPRRGRQPAAAGSAQRHTRLAPAGSRRRSPPTARASHAASR